MYQFIRRFFIFVFVLAFGFPFVPVAYAFWWTPVTSDCPCDTLTSRAIVAPPHIGTITPMTIRPSLSPEYRCDSVYGTFPIYNTECRLASVPNYSILFGHNQLSGSSSPQDRTEDPLQLCVQQFSPILSSPSYGTSVAPFVDQVQPDDVVIRITRATSHLTLTTIEGSIPCNYYGYLFGGSCMYGGYGGWSMRYDQVWEYKAHSSNDALELLIECEMYPVGCQWMTFY